MYKNQYFADVRKPQPITNFQLSVKNLSFSKMLYAAVLFQSTACVLNSINLPVDVRIFGNNCSLNV